MNPNKILLSLPALKVNNFSTHSFIFCILYIYKSLEEKKYPQQQHLKTWQHRQSRSMLWNRWRRNIWTIWSEHFFSFLPHSSTQCCWLALSQIVQLEVDLRYILSTHIFLVMFSFLRLIFIDEIVPMRAPSTFLRWARLIVGRWWSISFFSRLRSFLSLCTHNFSFMCRPLLVYISR